MQGSTASVTSDGAKHIIVRRLTVTNAGNFVIHGAPMIKRSYKSILSVPRRTCLPLGRAEIAILPLSRKDELPAIHEILLALTLIATVAPPWSQIAYMAFADNTRCNRFADTGFCLGGSTKRCALTISTTRRPLPRNSSC